MPASLSPTTSTSPVCTPGTDLEAERRHGVADRRARSGSRAPARRTWRGSRRRLCRPRGRGSGRARAGRRRGAPRAARASARSPSSAARSVEPTMSVKSTVASTRSGSGPSADAGQELLDLVEDRSGVAARESGRRPELDEARPGDVRGDVAAPRRWRRVAGRWRTSVGTRIVGSTWRTSISAVHQHEGERGARAAPTLERCAATSAIARRRLLGAIGRGRTLAPVASTCVGVASRSSRVGAHGYSSSGSRRLAIRPVEDERARPLGVRGGEEDAHRPALREAEQRRPLAAGGVHHRPNVVHARLEVGQSARPVGQPVPRLSKRIRRENDASRSRKCAMRRVLPVELEVGDEPGHEHEVERALADHLVGDVDVAALRVASSQARRRHRASTSPERPSARAHLLLEVDARTSDEILHRARPAPPSGTRAPPPVRRVHAAIPATSLRQPLGRSRRKSHI